MLPGKLTAPLPTGSTLPSLNYTKENLRPLAEDTGFAGAPFVWNEERRFPHRVELDVALFLRSLPTNADAV